MSLIALQPTTTYRRLRSAYDHAFQQLAREVRQLSRLQTLSSVGNQNVSAALEQVAAAERCYVETRNALADFLLSRQAEGDVTAPSPKPIPDEQARASIQEQAYFLWENAGKPRGNDQANWYRAEARVFSSASAAPYASR